MVNSWGYTRTEGRKREGTRAGERGVRCSTDMGKGQINIKWGVGEGQERIFQ